MSDGDYPEAWRPEPGDRITGKVENVVMGPDFGYGPYPILTVTLADGSQKAIHAQATILRTELRERNVRRGDDLDITYLGKKPPKSGTGNPYHTYKVAGGTEPEFNWDSDAPGGGAKDATQAVPIAPMTVEQVDALRQARSGEESQVLAASAAENFGDKPPF